jgi:glycosyltransferase involved in cell wall biosynthesis
MKKVLFISLTRYELDKTDSHLEKKFFGLSEKTKIFLIGRGKIGHYRKYQSDFYLIPRLAGFWYFIAFFLGLFLIFSKKIEVIITQSPLVDGFLGVLLKKISKRELIVEIHGDWIEGPFLSKKRKLAFLEKKIMPILAKISFRNADKIRAVADYLADEAKKIAPKKSYFIFPTFTDLSIFLYEKETRFDDFILFVGHIQKVKGVDYLIDAFNKISKDFPDFKLIMVGEKGGYQSEGNIQFKGRLSLEETKNIMKNCYCLVLPSLSEGLPRVIMEAMALGKPVIASNVGGIPELIRNNENGFLFETGNSHDLAEKLSILLKDRDLALKLGERGRIFAKNNFSNENYIENYIKMINF